MTTREIAAVYAAAAVTARRNEEQRQRFLAAEAVHAEAMALAAEHK